MSKLKHGLSDKLAISGGREIGFDLEKVAVILMTSRKKTAVSDMVLARIERTLEARKGQEK